MRTLLASLVVTLSALFLLACSHDLEALKTPSGAGGSGNAGQGAGGNGSGGTGGTSGGKAGQGGSSGSGGAAGAGDPNACKPCATPPSILAGAVKPTSCCTGSHNSDCGEQFPTVDMCYPLAVPGNTGDPVCLEHTHGNLTFPGCCRPDGQCGIVVDQLHLGCVVRQEVPIAIGGPLKAHVCDPTCATDADCMAFNDELICTQDTTGPRSCERFCQRDKDCSDLSGRVCAIQNNVTDNRVDTLCRRPFGTGNAGDTCKVPSDCIHGTCLPAKAPATGNVCTELCGSDTDCSLSTATCVTGTIITPNPPHDKQTIRFCR